VIFGTFAAITRVLHDDLSFTLVGQLPCLGYSKRFR
jgi:hypothetical protein